MKTIMIIINEIDHFLNLWCEQVSYWIIFPCYNFYCNRKQRVVMQVFYFSILITLPTKNVFYWYIIGYISNIKFTSQLSQPHSTMLIGISISIIYLGSRSISLFHKTIRTYMLWLDVSHSFADAVLNRYIIRDEWFEVFNIFREWH